MPQRAQPSPQQRSKQSSRPNLASMEPVRVDDRAIRLVEQVCFLAGQRNLVRNVQRDLAAQGVLDALDRRDTPLIYNHLVRGLAYQGISDYVAHDYMERHGSVTWHQIEESLRAPPSCSKLHSYWQFHKCGYNKSSRICSEPKLTRRCPLAAHPLRNGRLNQSAYSLYFFMRDIAGGDFVGWLESNIAKGRRSGRQPSVVAGDLVVSTRHLYGVSNKMLTMTLSDILIGGGGGGRPFWRRVGAEMIVIDTLVHNFLWRAGILRRHDAEHPYGPRCYGPNGCASLIGAISRQIDARQFNPSFPRTFPRFVQHAIWQFCAQQGLDICNGNRINDRERCAVIWCPVFKHCDRRRLPLPVTVEVRQ
jgi:hypothetical protein